MSLSNSAMHFITSTLNQLTIEEKVALLSGSSFVAATGVPRLGIPAINLVDSINGVKGASHINGTPTLCFPSTTCLGSTWNTSLMNEMGKELAVQAKYKNSSVILGPTVNIHRDPRGGRNFECFSEDPLLTGRLAAALINGIQSGGVAACPKHFVGNESETKRRFYRVEAEKRTMREIYLAAFQHLLRASTPMAIMTAYNKFNGAYCSESPIIKDILRDEWEFEGCVMSDWFGTRSGLPALNAGLDLEMPGPSVFRGKQLAEDFERGSVKLEVIDERVRRVLALVHKTSASHATGQERSVVDEKANLLARQVASEGIVLLKNENSILPLKFEGGTKVAVIGAAAKDPPIGGGGSAKVPPQYIQAPLNCIRSAHSDSSLVSYSWGCKTHCTVPGTSLELLSAKNGQHGIDVQYFVHGNSSPALEEFLPSAQIAMLGFLKSPLTQDTFSHFVVSTDITATSPGNHTLAVQATGAFKFFVEGELALSDDMQPPPSVEDFLFVPEALERKVSILMEANKPYHLKAVIQPYVPAEETGEPRVHAAKLCFEEEYSEPDQRSNAVQVASSSDVSIIFAGRNAEMESEGFDLTSIKLPSNQELLIQDIAKASKKTILVLYGGNPIDISAYEDLVDAILFAHFPGQEGSQAIADILTGKTCPSGKLATSWPMKLEDVPTYGHFPARKRCNGEWEIGYTEGLRVGYRAEAEADGYAPRYRFGYGLSYTRFEYSGLCCFETAAGGLLVEVGVSNVGAVAGCDVVQVFISEVNPVVWRPREELKGFEKISLEPGERKTVRIDVDRRVAFSWWDGESGERACWRAEPGEFKVRIGNLCSSFMLKEGFSWWGL